MSLDLVQSLERWRRRGGDRGARRSVAKVALALVEDASAMLAARRRAALRGLAVASLVAGHVAAFGAKPALEVHDAQLRMPRPGFNATVVSMTLKSSRDAVLLAASSPVAGQTEIHRFVRSGSELRMEAVSKLPLPAGAEVRLTMAETAFHLMAMQLKRPLASGESVPLRLLIEDARSRERREMRVQARVVGSRRASDAGDSHSH